MISYKIISSSSKGNAVLYFDDEILIDVGLPYNKLKKHISKVKYILLTHSHGDHFKDNAISMICKHRPDITWIIPTYLQDLFKPLKLIHTKYVNIEIDKKYRIEDYIIQPIKAIHDVPNVGYKIFKNKKKMLHITDTGSIDHIVAKDYDLYAIEYNHDEFEILYEIELKRREGIFAHELRSKDTHLSFQQANDWIEKMIGPNSEVIMLHISSKYRRDKI